MPLIPVQTLDDPRLVVFRDVKATRHSKWKGRFITEGARLAKRLLATDYVVESMLLTEGRVEEFSSWLRPDVPTFVMPQTLAAELIGYNFHCGAMACALRKPNPSLDEIMARGGERMTFVVCPDVNDPENIGTLIRLGAAFGIDAMLLGPACADPFSRRVLRVSMGNALTLPIVCSRDLTADLRRLKSEWRVQLAATIVENTDPTDDDVGVRATELAEPLGQAGRPARLALLFGNEANGLGPEWLEQCDRRLTIPMQAADSLNVAVAAGIFLHHFTTSAFDATPKGQSVSRP
ncbi:MAG: RNA methyltransferase [Planctomycetota bacterium]|nr:MAG: RNA methyltransferase [Planctomycetota bacterium]GDY08253.1 rRNA methyltransferase [Planctomycetia bacterium]